MVKAGERMNREEAKHASWRFNIRESWNAWDSLAEVLRVYGNKLDRAEILEVIREGRAQGHSLKVMPDER